MQLIKGSNGQLQIVPGFTPVAPINTGIPNALPAFPIAPANPVGAPGMNMPAAQTNTYPGKSMKLSLDQAQLLATSATKSRGYRHTLLAGQVNLFPGLQISGTAGLLLGMTVMLVEQLATPQNAPQNITLTINNYSVVNQTGFNFFNKLFMQHAFYFPLNQPLSGQDSVEISYNNVGAPQQNVDLVFWYL